MLERINTINPKYNGTLFRIKRTLGDILVPRTSKGVSSQPFYEGYFMEIRPLSKDYVAPDKTNPVIKFFKRMVEEYKGIRDAMKPEENEEAKTIGMTFEA